MSITDKLKWLKLIDEHRYVYKQLNYIDDIAADAAQDFNEYYADFCKRKGINIKELEEQNAERLDIIYNRNEKNKDGEEDLEENQIPPDASGNPGEIQLYNGEQLEEEEQCPIQEMSKDDKEIHEIFLRLYKKIAVIIHPDKLLNNKEFSIREKKKMATLFSEASGALEKRKYFVLLEIAEELEILLPKNYAQQTRWLKKEMKDIRGQLGKRQMTYNYMFAEAETDEQRDLLVRKFMNQLFGIVVPIASDEATE
tara:strand:+ start:1242 stop:2003 length:762 start_codon:yes stop_codon:yes gene_type:complete